MMKTIKLLVASVLLMTSGCAVWFRNGEHGVGQPPPPAVPSEPYLHFNNQTGQWELSDR